MFQEPDIATVAALIGEPTRALMLTALMRGEALPASELAACAHVTPQTASSHLAKLLDANLITVKVAGRHRYYALSSQQVAQTLEALQAIAPMPKTTPARKPKIAPELCHARTCYDHLAGRLGVSLADAMLAQGYLTEDDQTYHLTEKGLTLAYEWDIDVDALKKKRRKFAYACLDWSERRFHIAGAFGAAMTDTFLERGWVRRLPETRALRLTVAGEMALQTHFRIRMEAPAPPELIS